MADLVGAAGRRRYSHSFNDNCARTAAFLFRPILFLVDAGLNLEALRAPPD